MTIQSIHAPTYRQSHQEQFCNNLTEQTPLPTMTPIGMTIAQFLKLMIIILILNCICTIWSLPTITLGSPQHINNKQVLKKIHK